MRHFSQKYFTMFRGFVRGWEFFQFHSQGAFHAEKKVQLAGDDDDDDKTCSQYLRVMSSDVSLIKRFMYDVTRGA